jgi:hypothetical protein
MTDEQQQSAGQNGEEMEDQRLINHMIDHHKLNEELSHELRDAAMAIVKRYLICRRSHYKKFERQSKLRQIRDSVQLLRNAFEGSHAGFFEILESVESSIENDYDSLSKGYIDR